MLMKNTFKNFARVFSLLPMCSHFAEILSSKTGESSRGNVKLTLKVERLHLFFMKNERYVDKWTEFSSFFMQSWIIERIWRKSATWWISWWISKCAIFPLFLPSFVKQIQYGYHINNQLHSLHNVSQLYCWC